MILICACSRTWWLDQHQVCFVSSAEITKWDNLDRAHAGVVSTGMFSHGCYREHWLYSWFIKGKVSVCKSQRNR